MDLICAMLRFMFVWVFFFFCGFFFFKLKNETCFSMWSTLHEAPETG